MSSQGRTPESPILWTREDYREMIAYHGGELEKAREDLYANPQNLEAVGAMDSATVGIEVGIAGLSILRARQQSSTKTPGNI